MRPVLPGTLLAVLACSSAHGADGHVVWSDPNCNYFIAKLAEEYGIYEWRTGNALNDEDDISGDLTATGMLTVENKTRGGKNDVILVAMSGRLTVLINSSPVMCKRRFQKQP